MDNAATMVGWSLTFAMNPKVGYNTVQFAGAGGSQTLEGGLRALITGVSGFVGSHLAEYLLEATEWEVAGTVFGPYGNIASLCGQLEL